jgi:hypothetical protein
MSDFNICLWVTKTTNMAPRSRLSRTLLIAATAAGFAASAGSASAAPSDNSLQTRSDNAPGGAVTAVDDHRPAGAGEGRKIG